jgi:hypothetical protein
MFISYAVILKKNHYVVNVLFVLSADVALRKKNITFRSSIHIDNVMSPLLGHRLPYGLHKENGP